MNKSILFVLAMALALNAEAAVNQAAEWRIRVAGNELNCAGYDATISGAGTDYSDQDSPQLSLTDLATPGAASTTLTSATGGFTAAMIGNCVRISAGTNFTPGYYFITVRTDTNTVTLDRTASPSGAGSVGTGRVGGAWAGIINLASGASGCTAPAIAADSTDPAVPGNTVWIRGSGSEDPSPASPDYDWTCGYWTAGSVGTSAGGPIGLIGYNGRPMVEQSGLMVNGAAYWQFFHMKFSCDTTSMIYPTVGIGNGAGVSLYDSIFDQNGVDCAGIFVGGAEVVNNDFRNSGTKTAGTSPSSAIRPSGGTGSPNRYGLVAIGNKFSDWRGSCVLQSGPAMGIWLFNIFENCQFDGWNMSATNCNYDSIWYGNTFDANQRYGMVISQATCLDAVTIINNIFSNHSGTGDIGLFANFGSTSANDLARQRIWNYNVFFNNDSDRSNISAGANDSTADPQFTDAANDDYSVGTNMKAIGFPGPFPGGATTTTFLEPGAAQRQEPAGGGGVTIAPGAVGY